MKEKFINNTSLPKTLNDKDFLINYKKFLEGDKEAFDILVKSNLKLVYWYIDNYILCTPDEYDEIFAVASEALVESFYKYDINKDIKFSTFLIPCIRNKILKYFRSKKKHTGIISLDEEVYVDNEELTFKDIIIDNNYSLEDELIDAYFFDYNINKIMLELDKLNDTDRLIINLYFGFIDNKIYNQSEISKIIGLSQSQVSKRLTRTLKQIRTNLDIQEENKLTRKIA